jgi:hypothetical protein
VLAINLPADSEHYGSVADFEEAFFRGFQSLLQPGRYPRWRGVDIAREMPGIDFRPRRNGFNTTLGWLKRRM